MFGQRLVERGVITQQQLDEAIHKQQTTMSNRKLGEVLVRLGYISKSHIAEGLADQLGIPMVQISDREIPEQIRNQIEPNVATLYKVIPLAEEGDRLIIATADPTNMTQLDNLERLLERPIETQMASSEEINAALGKYYGLAEKHALTLDVGDFDRGFEKGGRIMLYLDCWIYWPDSSTVMALAQDPRHEIQPLALQVRDAQGQWQTAIPSVGLPTSKGIVVPVDITDCFLTRDRRIRLVTNMRIYFDRIFLSNRDQASRCRVIELSVARARLRYRGFSRLERDRFGFERFKYDHVSSIGSWNPPAGMFTRYGDVTTLLKKPDDDYVILGPGDEVTMHFDGRGLPPLPEGWIRDFIFFANGWVKDGDLNTKFSETVEPLPYHGMPGYPYPSRPGSGANPNPYNTRPMVPTVGSLPRAGPVSR